MKYNPMKETKKLKGRPESPSRSDITSLERRADKSLEPKEEQPLYKAYLDQRQQARLRQRVGGADASRIGHSDGSAFTRR